MPNARRRAGGRSARLDAAALEQLVRRGLERAAEAWQRCAAQPNATLALDELPCVCAMSRFAADEHLRAAHALWRTPVPGTRSSLHCSLFTVLAVLNCYATFRVRVQYMYG